jgi:hypothetical protein
MARKSTKTEEANEIAGGTVENLEERIRERAYALYVQRGFRDGCALEDWLDAEHEIQGQAPPQSVMSATATA